MSKMIRPTWLLRLYPQKWRERYETEMCALLEQHAFTVLTLVDLLVGALDARIDPQYRTGGVIPMSQMHRLRSAAMMAFIAFPCFLVPAAWVYVQTVDPDPGEFTDHYSASLHASPVLHAATIISQGSLMVALLAMLIALLVSAASLRRIAGQPGRLALVGSGVCAIALLLVVRAPSMLIMLGIVVLMFAVVMTAFARHPGSAMLLRLLVVPTSVASIAMMGMWIATTAAWAVLFLDSQSRPTPWFTHLDMVLMIITIVWLAIPALVALGAIVRGIPALFANGTASPEG